MIHTVVGLMFLSIIYTIRLTSKTGMINIKTQTGHSYLVNDIHRREEAAELLDALYLKLDHLINRFDIKTVEYIVNTKQYSELGVMELHGYLNRLKIRFPGVKIEENSKLKPELDLTSYSVNKGDKLVFCIRKPNDPIEFVDLNTLTYVALHEITHIACPEIGHTELFHKIFKFITLTAIEYKVYSYQDYESNPKAYCGIEIDENILK